MSDVISTVGSGAGRIGRYFTVVSALPAAVFVSYLYLLLRATSWFGPVKWSRLADFRPGDLVVLGIAALVLALAMNPLQFPLIQLFEGYWGRSALAVELASIRTVHHQRRLQDLEDGENASLDPEGFGDAGNGMPTDVPPDELHQAIVGTESARIRTGYPDSRRVLPTRLGNVLRRYEDAIARPYGLEPLVAVPRLVMVAGQPELAYVQNQRVQMELAIRTTLVALLATPLTAATMWRSGFWVLLAALPYGVAFLAYRGAVALAHEYGTSLAVLTDMSRFALYERLHLPHPPDTLAERTMNGKLMPLFALENSSWLVYKKPEGAPAAAQTPQQPDQDQE